MSPKIVAGERVDVLAEAFRQMEFKKNKAGWVRITATLDRELGVPFRRALTRIERELLDQDRRRGDTQWRTAEQRGADAFVVLAVRVGKALDGS